MKAAGVFVGLITCPPGRHRPFLEWHDGDHRPENVGQIPHMFHSARWIAPPESVPCREFGPDSPVGEAGEYLRPVQGYSDPALGLSPDAVPLVPHDGLVVTVGRAPDDGGQWSAEYDRAILPSLLASGSVLAALTLTAASPSEAAPRLFVHRHYTRGNPVEAQQAIRAAVGANPEIDYRGAYVPQHWSQPQFFR